MLFDRHHRSPVRNSFLRFGLEIPTLTVGDDGSPIGISRFARSPLGCVLIIAVAAGHWERSMARQSSVISSASTSTDVNNTSLWYRYAYLSFRYNVGASWQINPSLRWENLIFAGGGVSTLGLRQFFRWQAGHDPQSLMMKTLAVSWNTALTPSRLGIQLKCSRSVVGYSSLLHLVRIISTSPIQELNDLYQSYINTVIFADWQF